MVYSLFISILVMVFKTSDNIKYFHEILSEIAIESSKNIENEMNNIYNHLHESDKNKLNLIKIKILF